MNQIRFAILSLLFLQNMAFSSQTMKENTDFSNNFEGGKNTGKTVKNSEKNYSVPPHDESFFLTADEDGGYNSTESDATYDSDYEDSGKVSDATYDSSVPPHDESFFLTADEDGGYDSTESDVIYDSSVPHHYKSFFLTGDEDGGYDSTESDVIYDSDYEDSGKVSDATYDSNDEFEFSNQQSIQSVDLSRFQARDIKRKRPFVSSKALKENSPPAPKSLDFEKNSSWFYFNEGAIHSYAGMTRNQRKQLKKLGHQQMLPSPPKKAPPAQEYITKNNRRLFETSAALQGFSRGSYQFMVLEGRENLSLDDALKPILDHFQTKLDAKIPVTPDEINKLFWDQVSPFFDVQEKVGDYIFCLNKNHLQETDALSRITAGRNPLLQTGGVTQKGNYHHLTQGLSSPEIIVYVSADFHTRHNDLLHPFLKPGMDSVAHETNTEREWSQAKKEFHLTLATMLKEKEEQSIESANKRSRPVDSQKLEPPSKKQRLLTISDFLD